MLPYRASFSTKFGSVRTKSEIPTSSEFSPCSLSVKDGPVRKLIYWKRKMLLQRNPLSEIAPWIIGTAKLVSPITTIPGSRKQRSPLLSREAGNRYENNPLFRINKDATLSGMNVPMPGNTVARKGPEEGRHRFSLLSISLIFLKAEAVHSGNADLGAHPLVAVLLLWGIGSRGEKSPLGFHVVNQKLVLMAPGLGILRRINDLRHFICF